MTIFVISSLFHFPSYIVYDQFPHISHLHYFLSLIYIEYEYVEVIVSMSPFWKIYRNISSAIRHSLYILKLQLESKMHIHTFPLLSSKVLLHNIYLNFMEKKKWVTTTLASTAHHLRLVPEILFISHRWLVLAKWNEFLICGLSHEAIYLI